MIKKEIYSSVFKASPFLGLVLHCTNQKFNISAVTDAYLKVFKQKESEILGTDFLESLVFSDPASQEGDMQRLHRFFLATLEGGLPRKLEGFYLKFRDKEGLPQHGCYVDVEAIPVLNESDLRESILVYFKETEKRSFATNPDSQNSQYYKQIIENSLNAFFLTKPDGTILEANAAACDMFGYTLDELRLVGRQGIIDHSEAYTHEKIKERNETGKVKAELVGIKKSGEKFPIEVSSLIFLDENGETRSSVTINDISLRKRTEEELLKSEKKYKTLFEDNPLPMLIWDFETRNIIDCNKEAILKYGYTREEFLQLNIREIRPKEDYDLIDSVTASESEYGQIHKRVWRHLKKSGELMLMEITGHLMNYNGRMVSVVLLNDVTDRKNEEEQKLVLAEISRLFNQTISFSETLNQVLQSVMTTGNYCMAEFWLMGSDKKDMNRLVKHVAGDKTELLSAQDEIRYSGQVKGLSALVGQTQTIQEWNLEEDNYYFIPSNGAIHARVKKVIGIPLFCNEAVVGSLLLACENAEKMPHDFIFQSHDFGSQLGEEIKRKQLEQELNQVFENSNDIICIADFNGYFKKINPAASKILGYTEEELLSRPYIEFVHPEDLQLTVAKAESHNSISAAHYFENRYIHKSGKIIWFAWSSNSSLEEQLIFAVGKDITEKKNLEVLLGKSNRLAVVGSWEVDVIEGTVYWSDITKEIWEVDPDFVPELSVGINYFKEGSNQETISNLVTACIENGTPWDEELQILTHKGNLKWIRTIGEAEIIYGKCVRVFGSFQDIDEKKKALIKLEESENRFRTILEAEPEFIMLLGPDGKLIMINPAGLAMVEAKSEAQLIGRFLSEIILPEHRDAFLELTTNVFKGESRQLIFEIKGLRGTRRWLETHAVPMKNEQGNIISLLGVTRDITASKTALDEIRDSEEKRRLIMNGALDAIICIDTNETITFWNPQAEFIFGWKEADAMGQQLSELIVPKPLRGYHNEGINRYLKIGEGKALNKLLELTAIRQSGEEFPIELTVIPVKQEGAEVFFCAFIRDISERKIAEENLRQSNERFEKVTLATNDAIWDWDIVNKTYYRSKGIEQLFGKSAAGLFPERDMWSRNYYHLGDRDKIKHSFHEAITDPSCTRWESEYRVINEIGELHYVIDRAVIIRNNAGEAMRAVGVMTDITYRKEYEDSLMQLNETLIQNAKELALSNKELEQFAYVASHDLQEPLRMVTSFLNQLEKKYSDTIDDMGKQYIHFAVDGAKRMRQIILDLLEFSRVGRIEDLAEQVNTKEMVEDVISLYSMQIEESNASIALDELPNLKTHKATLFQVFQNLIGNALKYRHPERAPIIQVSCTEIPGYWKFSIKDNGIGIDEQYFEKIFIIFQRLHNKNEYFGTGIGLSVVKKIVNNMEGEIWLESKVGEGTVFHFTLPKESEIKKR